MENDSQSIAFACDKGAHAMAVSDGIGAALALDRPVVNGEHHTITLRQRHHAGAGLARGRCSVITNSPPVKSSPGSDNKIASCRGKTWSP